VRKANIQIHKVRITGGEPTLHPNLRAICEAVDSHWQPEKQSVVLTNGSLPKPDIGGLKFRYAWGTDKTKAELHRPWMISPVDMGLKPIVGFNGKDCWVQRGCGRGFDAFGFSCCVFAGALGRLFGIDPYSANPVEFGTEELCRHCVCSLSRKDQWRLWVDAMEGRLPTPTTEYVKALERVKSGTIKFKRFEEMTR